MREGLEKLVVRSIIKLKPIFKISLNILIIFCVSSELKAQSDFVKGGKYEIDSIIVSGLKTFNQKTVVSWSMNTDYIIQTEEHKTASLKQRLNAIQKVVKAGYLIGLHFDPMIYYPDWQADYMDLLQQLVKLV